MKKVGQALLLQLLLLVLCHGPGRGLGHPDRPFLTIPKSEKNSGDRRMVCSSGTTYDGFSSTRIVEESGDWKVSELESVIIHFLPILTKIGKCRNWKVTESESVRIGK